LVFQVISFPHVYTSEHTISLLSHLYLVRAPRFLIILDMITSKVFGRSSVHDAP